MPEIKILTHTFGEGCRRHSLYLRRDIRTQLDTRQDPVPSFDSYDTQVPSQAATSHSADSLESQRRWVPSVICSPLTRLRLLFSCPSGTDQRHLAFVLAELFGLEPRRENEALYLVQETNREGNERQQAEA